MKTVCSMSSLYMEREFHAEIEDPTWSCGNPPRPTEVVQAETPGPRVGDDEEECNPASKA